MKVLLVAINAKYIHANLAVYSLKAYADKCLFMDREIIEIAEYTINQQIDEIMSDIYLRKPDMIALSCYIWNIEVVIELTNELAQILPDVDIWLGGPEVSYDAQKTFVRLDNMGVNTVRGIMLGEGEDTFAELIKKYKENDSNRDECFRNIKGIACREFSSEERGLIDMDKLVFPYTDIEKFDNRIIYYESSRGCPFNCSYCLSAIDKSIRFRSVRMVKEELQFFLDKKVKQVKFVDRTFNSNHKHAMEILRFIYNQDNGITNFHFEISAEILTNEEIELLNLFRPGLAQLEIGVQTTNCSTLNKINRVTDFEKMCKTIKKIQAKENIHIHLDLIAGLPEESYEMFICSFNDVYSLRPDQLQLGFLKVLKGAPIREHALYYNINFQRKAPYEVLFTNQITYEEILKLKSVEKMVEIYYNSNQFNHTLQLLEQSYNSAFQMYKELADYYCDCGYSTAQPSRVKRYEILLAFACNKDRVNTENYQEILTRDLYLRENIKNRPLFAKDLTEYKEKIRNFYKNEASTHAIMPHYQEYNAAQISRLTHIEVFGRQGEETYILFDYEYKNSLTGNSMQYTIDL